MGDRIDARADNLGGRGWKDGGVRPDQDPLAVRFAGDGVDQIGRQIGIDLDGGGARAPRLRHGNLQVGGRRDRLHPGNLTLHGALARGVGARIVEELWAGHQGGEIDVGTWNFADPRGPGQIGDLAQIVGHVAHGGDPAVEVTLHHCFRPWAIGRRRQVLVGVDEAGQDEEARDVGDPCAGRDFQRRGRANGLDPFAVGKDRHVRTGGRARAVDEGRAAIEVIAVRRRRARRPRRRPHESDPENEKDCNPDRQSGHRSLLGSTPPTPGKLVLVRVEHVGPQVPTP